MAITANPLMVSEENGFAGTVNRMARISERIAGI